MQHVEVFLNGSLLFTAKGGVRLATPTSLHLNDVDLSDPEAVLVYYTTGHADVTHLTEAERKCMDLGHKITAIKSVRERTGLGLRDAKELVEKYRPPQQDPYYSN